MDINKIKFSIFRNRKDGSGETVQAIDFNTLINNIKEDTREGVITKFREVLKYLDKPQSYDGYKRIPRLCTASEYYRNKSMERVFRTYNGVSIVKIDDLTTSLEVEKAKKQASLMPQALCAMTGADNHSIVVLTLSSLPDGTLPKAEEAALLFAQKAYMTSVQCLQPLTEFHIKIEQPSLDSTCLMTVDPNPYVNIYATPFIIEQPTEISLKAFKASKGVVHSLSKLVPSAESMFTYIKVFEAAYYRALEETNWREGQQPEILINDVAQICSDADLPEEETTMQLHFRFRKMEIEDIRSMVHNVYEQNSEPKEKLPVNKHQYVAYRLKEFLFRRYDIRFNEVLQMTEFRERQSFHFMFRELSKREQNTIFHEAQIEGIAPTQGEVDAMIHSTLIPNFNPIEEYINNLPKWDGKDRMTALAKMVPTDNPHWERLFKQWFLSMVAHWMNGDEKHANSTAPILIGAQGFRKSTFCRLLLPPELQEFYTDSIDFRTNIEAERSLSRFLIINIDEFDQLTEKQFAFVKHLFQKPATNIRRMYSETIGTQRRYASFIGTTNSDEVLRDPTGNRRYLCVYVTDKIHTEQPIEYSQLYAQAVSLITSGTRYWINDEDEALIRETNGRFQVQSALEEHFLSVFATCKAGEDGTWMRLSDVMEELMQLPTFNKKQENSIPKLGKILTKLGAQKKRCTQGFEYLVKKK